MINSVKIRTEHHHIQSLPNLPILQHPLYLCHPIFKQLKANLFNHQGAFLTPVKLDQLTFLIDHESHIVMFYFVLLVSLLTLTLITRFLILFLEPRIVLQMCGSFSRCLLDTQIMVLLQDTLWVQNNLIIIEHSMQSTDNATSIVKL